MAGFIQDTAEDYDLAIETVSDIWEKYSSTKNYIGFYAELDKVVSKNSLK